MKQREAVTDIPVILCRAEDAAIVEGLGLDNGTFKEIKVTARDGTQFYLTPSGYSYKTRIAIEREIEVPDPEPKPQPAQTDTSDAS